MTADDFNHTTFEQVLAQLADLEHEAMQLDRDDSKRMDAMAAIREARRTFTATKLAVNKARAALARRDLTFRGLDETVRLGATSTVTRTTPGRIT